MLLVFESAKYSNADMCGSISSSNAFCLASTFSNFCSVFGDQEIRPGRINNWWPAHSLTPRHDIQDTPIMVPLATFEIGLILMTGDRYRDLIVRFSEMGVRFPEFHFDTVADKTRTTNDERISFGNT